MKTYLYIHCLYHTPMNTIKSLEPTLITFKTAFFQRNLGFSNLVIKKSSPPSFFRKSVRPLFFSKKSLKSKPHFHHSSPSINNGDLPSLRTDGQTHMKLMPSVGKSSISTLILVSGYLSDQK